MRIRATIPEKKIDDWYEFKWTIIHCKAKYIEEKKIFHLIFFVLFITQRLHVLDVQGNIATENKYICNKRTKNSSVMHHFFARFIVSFLCHFNHHNQHFFKFLKRSLFVNIFAKLIIERRFLTKKKMLLFFMNNYSAFHSLFHHIISVSLNF